MNASAATTSVERQVLQINLKPHSPEHYKPKLTYYGKVRSFIYTVSNITFHSLTVSKVLIKFG